LGGEPLLAADVESFRRIFTDGCRLLNIYAGAEMYYVCQYALDRDTPLTGPTAPIGFAVEGKEVLLLDEERRPVGPGEVGEIAVRSRYLATGYLNQPELTAAAFLPDPEGGERRIYLTGDLGRRNSDGSLVHMGRRNSMVKVRGQRVELGAVEHALRTCPGVIEAVVALREDARGEKVLVAYAVRQPTAKLTTATLRAALRERLPEVMVPQYVVFLDALPISRRCPIRPGRAATSPRRMWPRATNWRLGWPG
jgi:acyl-coenzyme A synthetase/AMP-(fatty) acid ligase